MDKKTRFRFFGFEYLERHVQIGIGLGVLFVLNFIFYIVTSVYCFLFYNNRINETASAFKNNLVHFVSGLLPYEIFIVSVLLIGGIIACVVVGIKKKKDKETRKREHISL